MNILQLLVGVPEWANERGLNEESFNILESIVLNPEQQETILSTLDDGQRCCILQALEHAEDKGLFN